MELAGGGAFLAAGGAAEGAEHAVERWIADAEPVLLADEMMAQMILLDPAAEPRSRLVGNMRDVMHPFIMQDRKHHPEQRGGRGLRPEHECWIYSALSAETGRGHRSQGPAKPTGDAGKCPQTGRRRMPNFRRPFIVASSNPLEKNVRPDAN